MHRNQYQTETTQDRELRCREEAYFLRLHYKGELMSGILYRQLNIVLSRTFFAAQLKCTFTSQSLFYQRQKDRLPHQATSVCIYRFACCWGASYIGKTMRSLSTRIGEHILVWLAKGEQKTIRNSILAHVLYTGQQVDPNKTLK